MSLWEWVFGPALTPADYLREHLRLLHRARREIDRERSKLQQQEKQLMSDIKRDARQGQMVGAAGR